jgi:NAD(P)-dependent dehydrogenase (short-subunit alcohol dehydrogenase family)
MENQKFRLGIFAIAATVATALNAIIFLIATAVGVSMEVTTLTESTSGIVNVLVGTFVSLMFAAAVLKLILKKRPGFADTASWLGFGFAVISSALPLIAGDDLLTGASLALMHLVGGLGWIVGVRFANQSTKPKFSIKVFPDHSLTIQPVSVESLDLSGRRVVVFGGTNGIGRAIARLAASRGAEVTVVGRTFRDEGVKGIEFVKSDLSSMKEAQRVGRELAVESTDVLLLTTGITPAKQREVTSEGIERDMAISYLSRLVLLQGLASRLGTNRTAAKVARVFVMGAPGTGGLGNLDDLSGERAYDWTAVHMNTVAGNEALVLDGARRSSAVHYFGLNPNIIKTNIRGPVLGGGIMHRVVEFFIGLFTQSAESYAKRIVPLLFAEELDAHNGVMFGHKANPILPSKGMTDAYVGQLIDSSQQLVENALLR